MGAVIFAARSRRSLPGPGKLRHNAAAVRAPSVVRARAVTFRMISRSSAVRGAMYARANNGDNLRITRGWPISAQNARVAGLYRRNPEPLTTTRPAIRSARVMANRHPA